MFLGVNVQYKCIFYRTTQARKASILLLHYHYLFHGQMITMRVWLLESNSNTVIVFMSNPISELWIAIKDKMHLSINSVCYTIIYIGACDCVCTTINSTTDNKMCRELLLLQVLKRTRTSHLMFFCIHSFLWLCGH